MAASVEGKALYNAMVKAAGSMAVGFRLLRRMEYGGQWRMKEGENPASTQLLVDAACAAVPIAHALACVVTENPVRSPSVPVRSFVRHLLHSCTPLAPLFPQNYNFRSYFLRRVKDNFEGAASLVEGSPEANAFLEKVRRV